MPSGSQTCFDDLIRDKLQARVPRNVSYKKITTEEKPRKKKQREESPTAEMIRLHKEEIMKMSTAMRDDDERRGKQSDFGLSKPSTEASDSDAFFADIKRAKIFATTQEELDIQRLMVEAEEFNR